MNVNVVIPPLFYAIGVPRVGGGLATILSAAELPTAVIMSYVVLNESVNWLQWFGVGITMIGITLLFSSSGKHSEKPYDFIRIE
ncbi:DMT family transporter [Paenibacillus sp. LHD-38]|uniref:DMT family transporter n=1 Tax=Paenibacillus sp. LHD-38 TaxID=3072143 RepID=UPI00280E8F98|nr:DMT family transporter [Paenibacillus sp. LHD-38]MDQ8736950.1 DMT family transporter [Paenibacillus sp. LHD-38]